MKAHGVVDARVHILEATALGRSRVGSPTLGGIYRRKCPGSCFTETERTLGKISTFSTPGNLRYPARSQAPCRLSYLDFVFCFIQ